MKISVTKPKYYSYEGICELKPNIGTLWVSLHTGATKPYEDWYQNTGCFNGVVNFEYHYWRWAWVIEFAYNDFIRIIPEDHFHWWNFSATMRYYLKLERFDPYVNVGPGIYLPDEGDTRFGFKTGVGVDYPVSDRFKIEIGTDYHHILAGSGDTFYQDQKTAFQHFHAGVIYNIME
jgi:hypothetical protein